MSEQQTTLTAEALKELKFRGPVKFYDGQNGMAQQDFECMTEPRFGYSWRRENRKDRGRQFFTVDGTEVKDLNEAARLLALPPAPDSPNEAWRRLKDEIDQSPLLEGRATSAVSEARCNANAGPLAPVRAWMERAGDAWHTGINDFAGIERKAGNDWPKWLYLSKNAMHELYRGVYLFEADNKKDTGLRCALGKSCRHCPILLSVGNAMVAARVREPFPRPIEDEDIYASKVATCIGHILTSGADVIDGAFFSRKEDREDRW